MEQADILQTQKLLAALEAVSLFIMMAISPCQCQRSVLYDAMYQLTPLQRTTLKLDDTQSCVNSNSHCASECTRRWALSQSCVAFVYIPLDMTCDFYKQGDVLVGATSVQVFMRQVRDRFQTLSINGQLFSIFLSSAQIPFTEARTACNALGGYLLEFDSLEEYTAVGAVTEGQIDGASYVGANDFNVSRTFVTDREGLLLDPLTWLWAPNEPDNVYEQCACIWYHHMKLADTRCYGDKTTFLCERDL